MLLVISLKKVIKPLIFIIIFSFLGLYFFYSNGYAENRIREEQELMEQMILKYEEDLQKGIDISKENYEIKKPNYSNRYTRTSLKLSDKIKKMIDGGVKFIFKKMNGMVNE